MKREKIITKVAYKKPGIPFDKNYLPVFPVLEPGVRVVEAYILEAAEVKRGDRSLVFQTIRVYTEDLVEDKKAIGGTDATS